MLAKNSRELAQLLEAHGLPWKELVEMTSKRPSYAARYARDENDYWTVVVDLGDRRTAISNGPTLPKASKRIRQAVALLLEVSEHSFDLIDDVRLGPSLTRALKRLQASQQRLEEQEARAETERLAVARALTKLGISRRDAGILLGVSGQRVQQLLEKCAD